MTCKRHTVIERVQQAHPTPAAVRARDFGEIRLAARVSEPVLASPRLPLTMHYSRFQCLIRSGSAHRPASPCCWRMRRQERRCCVRISRSGGGRVGHRLLTPRLCYQGTLSNVCRSCRGGTTPGRRRRQSRRCRYPAISAALLNEARRTKTMEVETLAAWRPKKCWYCVIELTEDITVPSKPASQ
jgi:hypothetical protein